MAPTRKLRALHTGALFRFLNHGATYVARGNGWYDAVGGYAGGPWCHQGDADVISCTCPNTVQRVFPRTDEHPDGGHLYDCPLFNK